MATYQAAEPKLRAMLEALERRRGTSAAPVYNTEGVQDREPSVRPADRSVALELLGGEEPVHPDERSHGSERAVQEARTVQGLRPSSSNRDDVPGVCPTIEERIRAGTISQEELQGRLEQRIAETELSGGGIPTQMNPDNVDRVNEIQARGSQHNEDVNFLITFIALLADENTALRKKVNLWIAEHISQNLGRMSLRR